MGQPFHPFGHADEQPEVGDLGHGADQLIADVVLLGEVVELVGEELLDRQRQPLVVAVDVDHARLHRVALLQHFIGVLEAPVPRHVGDVNQAVDALLHFHERAEVGEVAHLPGDHRADRISFGDGVPRILFQRFERQRDAAVGHVDVGDHRVHFAADAEHLRGIAHLLGPRHLGDVDQSFHAFLQLDERAVVCQRHHAAVHLDAERIAHHHVRPWIGRLLFVAERDALRGRIELEHHDLDLVADVEVFRGMIDAAPRDVGDVQQPVDPAEVDEDAVVGDVLDHAVGELPFLQAAEGLRFLRLLLHFQDGAARQHDVVPLLVEGDDLEFVFVAAQRVEVLDRLGVDERAGKERLDPADVDGESAFDAVDHAPVDRLVGFVRGLDAVPDQHSFGFLPR